MTKKIIGIDIDGVLADFITGFCEHLIKLTGKDLFSNGKAGLEAEFPNTWNFHLACGYTHEDDEAAWDAIGRSNHFWQNLKPMGGVLAVRNFTARLNKARWDGHEVYYITTRFGLDCKIQTEGWLQTHGAHLPTVIITKDKPSVVRALGVEAIIDDRLQNCNDIKRENPSCRVYMNHAPYNDRPTADREGIIGENTRDPRLIVINKVEEFLDKEGL